MTIAFHKTNDGFNGGHIQLRAPGCLHHAIFKNQFKAFVNPNEVPPGPVGAKIAAGVGTTGRGSLLSVRCEASRRALS